ncbi:MAG: riboflavin biosynthesis protein RibD [Bacteroidota bacterium]|jgi:diaminohydroxyphosphoribosylaminopyrimidine deaminase/5-amino-6-(5-phosphoribosylamino)uracil reductase
MRHEDFMHRCLDLARLGGIAVAPNPMVGCVLVKNGLIIGEGYHQKFGEAHAEVNAIASVQDAAAIEGATAYVSLEPCSHFGKTPPCSNLLIEKKVAHVVIATKDPNPKVAGKGIERLQKAGIQVTVGVLEDAARELNKRFFSFHEKQRPYVTLKWAQTKDGFLDKLRGDNEKGINWITGEEARALVHHWRSQEMSILVGKHTALNDNPSLTVRDVAGQNPIRILIDSQLQVKNDLSLFSEAAPTLIFNRIKNDQIDGIEWIKIKETSTKLILEELYKRGIHSVMVEGGSRTLQYFIIDNVWDEAFVLVGDLKFEQGVKAPVLNKIPVKSHYFGTDQVFYFKRRS